MRTWRRGAALLLALALAGPGHAQEPYALGAGNTRVHFRVKLLGLVPARGAFNDYTGTLQLDGRHWWRSQVAFDIRARSVDVGDGGINAWLRGADVLDADRYASVRFRSTTVERTSATGGLLHGDLTLHGVTRPVTLALSLEHLAGASLVNVSAVAAIRRSDFGVDVALPLVSDRVEVQLELQGVPLN